MTTTLPKAELSATLEDFRFLDPGIVLDGDLELVSPDERWIDEVMRVCRHPMTVRDMPSESKIARSSLEQFLRIAPGGRQPGNPARQWLPTYHFWMRSTLPPRARWGRISHELAIAGGIGLRIGASPDIELYTGNIGYHVYPPFRGRHYAERACRLVLPLARAHGMQQLWITCNPDNTPSRRTCQRLGAELVETVPIPPEHPFFARVERYKCRFRVRL
jgi:tagatose 1,6-diphosphate aldolase